MPGIGGTRSRGRSGLFAAILRAAPSPASCLPCRRSRVRIPSAASRDSALQSHKRCLRRPAALGAGGGISGRCAHWVRKTRASGEGRERLAEAAAEHRGEALGWRTILTRSDARAAGGGFLEIKRRASVVASAPSHLETGGPPRGATARWWPQAVCR